MAEFSYKMSCEKCNCTVIKASFTRISEYENEFGIVMCYDCRHKFPRWHPQMNDSVSIQHCLTCWEYFESKNLLHKHLRKFSGHSRNGFSYCPVCRLVDFSNDHFNGQCGKIIERNPSIYLNKFRM